MVTALEHIWQYLVTGVLAVLWFGRLEASTKSAHERITSLEAQRHEDLQASAASRSELVEMIREMRGDIKTLLRGGK